MKLNHQERMMMKELEENPFAVSAAMMARAASVPKSIVTRRATIAEAQRKERRRQACIRLNTCPTCEGKLDRGKKDKKNDYKRVWICQKCGESHHI